MMEDGSLLMDDFISLNQNDFLHRDSQNFL